MSLKSFVNSSNSFNLVLAAGIGLAVFTIARKALSDKEQAIVNRARITAYEAATATTSTNIDDLKNNLLKTLYAGALNPSLIINNLEAIKSEVDTYTAKLTTLATEKAAGRIDDYVINYYLQTIGKEIADKLHIEWKTSPGTHVGDYDDYTQRGYPYGGYGGYGGYPYGGGGGYGGYPYGGGGGGSGTGQYQDMYQQYLDYLNQIQTQYQGQYGYPSYGYSYGYGYQQPYMAPTTPIQNYNYYPQYGMASPYGYANQGGNYYSNYYPGQQQGGSIYNYIGPNQQGVYF